MFEPAGKFQNKLPKKNLANYSVIVNNWKGRHMGNNGGINAENTGAAWYQETICEYREN
jgi:hypothetical protein